MQTFKSTKWRNILLITLCLSFVAISSVMPKENESKSASVLPSDYIASTNSQRTAFIRGHSVACENEPFEIKEIVIPSEFNSLYQSFEALQKSQGLSLEEYKGEKVTRYSYKFIDSSSFVCLFVKDSRIIACAVIKNNEKAEFLKLIS